MELTKQQLYHLIKGTRALEDTKMELAAYLVADPETAPHVIELGKITPEELATFQQDELFKRRVGYLETHRPKKVKPPTDQAGYYEFALKGLWRLGRRAETDRDKITALKELAVVAGRAPDAKPQQNESGDLERMKQVFGGKGG